MAGVAWHGVSSLLSDNPLALINRRGVVYAPFLGIAELRSTVHRPPRVPRGSAAARRAGAANTPPSPAAGIAVANRLHGDTPRRKRGVYLQDANHPLGGGGSAPTSDTSLLVVIRPRTQPKRPNPPLSVDCVGRGGGCVGRGGSGVGGGT